MKLSILASMISGWLVKAWPGKPKPWIDLCGNAWTDAEVEKEIEAGNVEKVFAIRLTKKGVDALKKERKI